MAGVTRTAAAAARLAVACAVAAERGGARRRAASGAGWRAARLVLGLTCPPIASRFPRERFHSGVSISTGPYRDLGTPPDLC